MEVEASSCKRPGHKKGWWRYSVEACSTAIDALQLPPLLLYVSYIHQYSSTWDDILRIDLSVSPVCEP